MLDSPVRKACGKALWRTTLEEVLDTKGVGAGKRLDSSTLELVEVVFMSRDRHC